MAALICATAIIIFFTSCKEEEPENLDKSIFYPASYSFADYSTIVNPNNPYDNYGLLHNEAIDYFYLKRKYSGDSFDSYIQEAIDLASIFYAQKNPDGINGNFESLKNYYSELLQLEYSTPYGEKFDSSFATKLSKDFLEECLFDTSKTQLSLEAIVSSVIL